MAVSSLLSLVRRGMLGCLLVFGLVVAGGQTASAELTSISGVSFLGNHPVLGNVGMNAPGPFITNGPGLIPVTADLKFSFVGYATPADLITVENPILTFANGNIQFQIAPATHTFDYSQAIPEGILSAEILSASTTIVGLDVSSFIGGNFSFTYQNAEILAGQSQAGASGLLVLGSTTSSSYTFEIQAVPEPGSVVLSLLSLSALGLVVWRKYPRVAAA